jgi:hypothetical protein
LLSEGTEISFTTLTKGLIRNKLVAKTDPSQKCPVGNIGKAFKILEENLIIKKVRVSLY